MSKKGIALFLSVLFMCVLICPNSTIAGQDYDAVTGDHDIQPMWSYLSTFTNYFDIVGWGKVEADSVVTSFNADELSVELRLQQWKDNKAVTIKTWSNRDDGPVVGVSGIRYVESGYHYRIVSVAKAYVDGEVVEDNTYVSAWKEY